MTWAAAILLPAFGLAAGYWLGRFHRLRADAEFERFRAEMHQRWREGDERMKALLHRFSEAAHRTPEPPP